MKIGTALAVAVTAVCVQVVSARADEHERRGEERRPHAVRVMRPHIAKFCFLASCSHF